MQAADLLTPRPSRCRGSSFTWNSETRLLDITVNNKRTDLYSVQELTIDPEFGGRAFELEKVAGGSDPEANSYAVFVSTHGKAGDDCGCRGFLRLSYCKHAEAIRSIVENAWA